jgi:hypothetical protein
VLFAAIGAFGLRPGDRADADVVSSGVWIIPQHSIPNAVAGTVATADWNCANAGGINISSAAISADPTVSTWQTQILAGILRGLPGSSQDTRTGIITNLFGTGIVVKPPFLSGQRATLEIPPGGSIYICVNPTNTSFPLLTPPGVNVQGCGSAPDALLDTSITTPIGRCTGDGDGDLTFDSRNIGGFSQPSCDNRDSDTVVGEWTDDACFGPVFDANDAHLAVPDEFNDLSTVIVTYTCTRNPSFGGIVFPLTVQQDRGAVTFNVICVGTASASSVTLALAPSTLEIVPARSNTSSSLVQVTVLDSLGNPVPGIEVEIQTDRCALSAGSSAGTTLVTSLPIGVGFSDEAREVASALVRGLNTANPASYAAWEIWALAHFPNTVTPAGSSRVIAVTQNSAFSSATGLPGSAIASAILGCSPTAAPTATPGKGTVTAIVPVGSGIDIIKTAEFTVIGPPQSVVVAASPKSLVCGEKATVTATVKDIAGQAVSDHTRVEMVTNLGGVLAGTGAVASSAGPVVPISSTVADTFGGVATAFLLTSDSHDGKYEVVATSGGTTAGDAFGFDWRLFGTDQRGAFPQDVMGIIAAAGGSIFSVNPDIFSTIDLSVAAQTVLGGVFSTAPVSGQDTVECTIPVVVPAVAAPSIQAPRTGQGITPPNTGDAGLADSSSSWTLLVLGGVAMGLVGLASLKFARR